MMHLLSQVLVLFQSIRLGLTRHDTFDVLSSGNYWISGCGAQTDLVKALLDQTYNYLQEIIESIDSAGPLGTSAYNAFFKGDNTDDVKAVFDRIATGANIIVNGRLRHPTIMCISIGDRRTNRYWLECKYSNVNAVYLDGTELVYLCPSALGLQAYPESANCAMTPAPGNLVATGQDLTRTQFSTLLHELVHLYLQRPSLDPEEYGLPEVINLPADESVINPSSYAFYAANVVASCTHFDPPLWVSDGNLKGKLFNESILNETDVVHPDLECTSNLSKEDFGKCSEVQPDIVFVAQSGSIVQISTTRSAYPTIAVTA